MERQRNANNNNRRGRIRHQRREEGRETRNQVARILNRIKLIHNRVPNYKDYQFRQVMRSTDLKKKDVFRKTSKQILKKSNRLVGKILEKDPQNYNVEEELTQLDMKTRWSLNKAATIIFGCASDKSYVTINPEGNERRPAGPTRAMNLMDLTEKELNNMFQPATGGRKKVKRALGKQTTGRQISFETLYEYWKDTMSSRWGIDANPPEFPAGNQKLKDLWEHESDIDEDEIEITEENVRTAIQYLKNSTAPGYDGITGELWKLCDQRSVNQYLQKIIQHMANNGKILEVWKIGIISFLPKPDKPEDAYSQPKAWRPITILPTVNKIIGKIIMDAVSEGIQSQLSSAQKGGISKQLGTAECTFLLRNVIEHHRRNKTDLCIVFLDASNAFGNIEPALIRQALYLCNMQEAYRRLWLDLNTEVKIHIKSGHHVSKRIEMDRGVCQGGLSSLPTYNVTTDSLPKWIEDQDEGYEIGNAIIPDLVYVDDQALITILVEAMQRLLDMVGAWSTWSGVEFNAAKCWYFHETYQGRRAIHPDVELKINGQQIRKADPTETTWHLGIPVQLDQLCGSGGRATHLEKDKKFLPMIVQQVQQRADSIVELNHLNPVNAIELLDSMAKAKAMYACKVVAVPESFLTEIDTVIINAVRRILRIPIKQGSRIIVHAPTFMRGLRIKSMKQHYLEAILLTYFKLLRSNDPRLKEVIRVQIDQFLEDTNTGLLEPGENPPNHEPKLFYQARAELQYKCIDDESGEKQAEWVLIPKDEMKPRLKTESGRTLPAILFQTARKYQIAMSLDRWYIYDGLRWTEINQAVELKAWLRKQYLKQTEEKLKEVNHWNNFKPEEILSKKSYRWVRQAPTDQEPCLPRQIMVIGYQIIMGVIPVKWNKIRNRKADDVNCVMCERHRETIKHLFCSCQEEKIKNLKTARHDKVVEELAIWGQIAARKHKIVSVQINPCLDTDALRKPDLLYIHKKNNETYHTFIEVTVSMDNATRRSRMRKYHKYKNYIDEHARNNPNVIVKYKIFVFGVLGGIPEQFEKILAEIAPNARTDWVITQVHRAILVYNGAIWIERDKKYNQQQLEELHGNDLDKELEEPMQVE